MSSHHLFDHGSPKLRSKPKNCKANDRKLKKSTSAFVNNKEPSYSLRESSSAFIHREISINQASSKQGRLSTQNLNKDSQQKVSKKTTKIIGGHAMTIRDYTKLAAARQGQGKQAKLYDRCKYLNELKTNASFCLDSDRLEGVW